MKKRTHGRALAWVLVVSLVLSLVLPVLPTPAFAADAVTYEKVTQAPEDWSGEYLLVYEPDQLALDSSLEKVDAVNNYKNVQIVDNTITLPDHTLSVFVEKIDGQDGYVLKTATNQYIYYPSDTAKNAIETTMNKDTAAKYPITFTVEEDGTDIHLSSGPHMPFNNAANQMRFRYYKSTSYANQQPVALYRLAEGQVMPPEPTDPTQPPVTEPTEPPVTEPTAPTEPEVPTVSIADALAGADGTEFTVKGVVTLVDGKNLYLQDETGGICLRLGGNPTAKLGDTVIGTGKRGTFNGLPQLNGTCQSSSGLTLAPKRTTIGTLTNGDICTYVKLTGLEITEIYDNNGQFSKPNVTLKDDTGATIQLYKAVVDKDAFKVGDKVDITAAVGIHNGTYQLRNTLATEMVPYEEPLLSDGAHVVIYNPANMKALSTTYSGFYNNGTDVRFEGDKLAGYTDADVWTVGVNEDGTYTFSTADGKKLAMGDSFSSMPLDEKNPNWAVTEAATKGCYYIQNTARKNYIEWFADKGTWSSYGTIGSNEALFAQAFYKVDGVTPPAPPSGNLPNEGDQVMLYNVTAGQYAHQGVLGLQDDNVESPSIRDVSAAEEGGKITAGNGGVVFTVERNGEYFRFRNEAFGYLCSNGTGNNAFYSPTASDDADWTLDELNGGYRLKSRTAKYNGTGAQYLEYFGGSYKTYSYYPTDKTTGADVRDIYTFRFLPTANANLTEGVVNQPTVVFGELSDAYVGADYTFTFTADTVFGIKGDLTVSVGGTKLTPNAEGVYTLPKDKVTGDSFTITVEGVDNKGVAISGSYTVKVLDEPVIGEVTPKPNSETGDNKRPEISAVVTNAGDKPTITLTVNNEAVKAAYADGKVTYTPDKDMTDGKVTVKLTVQRADGKQADKTWSFTVGKAQYQLYFGQLHSHTTYSDGSGSLASALEYVKGLPEDANVDFVAFTDHSNYFDEKNSANPEDALYDMSKATPSSQEVWKEYKGTIANFNASQSDVVAIGGFEMTWSGGPGHINTFNTPGIVSRNNKTLNNKTDDAGMKAYYSLLSRPEGAGSLSQFNHPGSTFGTFSDFAYWDAVIDTRIQMVEVGNGEGAIGAGGYFPSYEYYTMALDKGWHLAPTNNQDNHKGKWGNANNARDVVLTDDFSEQGIYKAIQDMRMYATEDKNLEIYYSVNGNLLGSTISEVPEKLNFSVQVSDPDGSDSIQKVELIVNSGKVAYTWDDAAVLASGDLSCELDPDYTYYYVRVTQNDGDLAVTSPVWVGESLKLGLSNLTCGTEVPVTGEELTLTTTLFNSESSPAQVKSVTYTLNGGQVIGTDTKGYEIPASGTVEIPFQYVPDTPRVCNITATAVVVLNDVEYTFSKSIELDIQNADSLVYVGIDGSHFNEYVAGNYKDSMGNFTKLAAQYSVRTVQLNTSEELISACSDPKFKALILTAPSRRNGTSLRDPYATYSDAELDAIAAFNAAGGSVVVAGWSDYYENYAKFPHADHMAAQQNKLLAALGSSLRVSDDGTNDDKLNGGQSQRLYLNTYGDSFLTDRVEVDPEHPNDRMYSEVFSQYGGASIYAVDGAGNPVTTIPDTVDPVVFGHASTYSKDSDNDGLGGDQVPKYAVAEGDDRLMLMATEQMDGKGLVVVAGAAFMSNFEVQAQLDNASEKNYSNYKICQNLLNDLNPAQITSIADVQGEPEEGIKFTIEGVVTSNASGHDKQTAFFDCIYLQDETGGINAFPVSGDYKIGDRVRISGTTSSYQGERQINVKSIEKIGEGTVTAKEVTAQQINDRSVLGQLVTLKGYVTSFEKANGLVQTIMVRDAQGDTARVFIDGYITTGQEVKDLQVGCEITVTGCASYDDTFNAPNGPFARIRVRDRADVICGDLIHTHSWSDWKLEKEPTCTEEGFEIRTCSCGGQEKRSIPALGHTWGDWTVTKEPTASTDGEKVRTCSRCHAEEKVVLPATGGSTTPTTPGGSTTPTTPGGNRPATGDQSNAMVWAILLVVSVVCIAAVAFTMRKKKK